MIGVCKLGGGSAGKLSVTAVGHACAAPFGKDIVCASASALWLQMVEAIRAVGCDVKEFREPGMCRLETAGMLADKISDSYMKLMRELADDFPDCVEIVGQVGEQPACGEHRMSGEEQSYGTSERTMDL